MATKLGQQTGRKKAREARAGKLGQQVGAKPTQAAVKRRKEAREKAKKEAERKKKELKKSREEFDAKSIPEYKKQYNQLPSWQKKYFTSPEKLQQKQDQIISKVDKSIERAQREYSEAKQERKETDEDDEEDRLDRYIEQYRAELKAYKKSKRQLQQGKFIEYKEITDFAARSGVAALNEEKARQSRLEQKREFKSEFEETTGIDYDTAMRTFSPGAKADLFARYRAKQKGISKEKAIEQLKEEGVISVKKTEVPVEVPAEFQPPKEGHPLLPSVPTKTTKRKPVSEVQPSLRLKGQLLSSMGFKKGEFKGGKKGFSWSFNWDTFRPVKGIGGFAWNKFETSARTLFSQDLSGGISTKNVPVNPTPESKLLTGGAQLATYASPAGRYILSAMGAEHILTPAGRREIRKIGETAEKKYRMPSETAWLLPVAEIGLGTSKYWFPKAKGKLSTRGRKEVKFTSPEYKSVEAGKATFPETGKGMSWSARTKKQLQKFSKPGELQTKYGYGKGGIHTFPEQPSFFTDSGELTKPLHIAPQTGPSPFFMRTSSVSDNVVKSSWFNRILERLAPKGASKPGAAFVEPKEFKIMYGKETERGKYFWAGKTQPGVAYLPGTKSEIEAVITPGTQVAGTGGKFFFKYRGVRYPLDTFKTVGGATKAGESTVSGSFKDVIGKYTLPSGSPYYAPAGSSSTALGLSSIKNIYSKEYQPTTSSKISSISRDFSRISSSSRKSFLIASSLFKSRASKKTPKSEIGFSSIVRDFTTRQPPSRPSYSPPKRPSYGLPPSRPPKKKPPIAPPYLRFNLPKTKRKPSTTKRRKKQTSVFRKPTLAAIGLNIREKKRRAGEFTGMGIRPILKKSKSKKKKTKKKSKSIFGRSGQL